MNLSSHFSYWYELSNGLWLEIVVQIVWKVILFRVFANINKSERQKNKRTDEPLWKSTSFTTNSSALRNYHCSYHNSIKTLKLFIITHHIVAIASLKHKFWAGKQLCAIRSKRQSWNKRNFAISSTVKQVKKILLKCFLFSCTSNVCLNILIGLNRG